MFKTELSLTSFNFGKLKYIIDFDLIRTIDTINDIMINKIGCISGYFEGCTTTEILTRYDFVRAFKITAKSIEVH